MRLAVTTTVVLGTLAAAVAGRRARRLREEADLWAVATAAVEES